MVRAGRHLDAADRRSARQRAHDEGLPGHEQHVHDDAVGHRASRRAPTTSMSMPTATTRSTIAPPPTRSADPASAPRRLHLTDAGERQLRIGVHARGQLGRQLRQVQHQPRDRRSRSRRVTDDAGGRDEPRAGQRHPDRPDVCPAATAAPPRPLGSISPAAAHRDGRERDRGVVAQANWNSATGARETSPLALVDETGAATNATVTWSANGGWADSDHRSARATCG